MESHVAGGHAGRFRRGRPGSAVDAARQLEGRCCAYDRGGRTDRPRIVRGAPLTIARGDPEFCWPSLDWGMIEQSLVREAGSAPECHDSSWAQPDHAVAANFRFWGWSGPVR